MPKTSSGVSWVSCSRAVGVPIAFLFVVGCASSAVTSSDAGDSPSPVASSPDDGGASETTVDAAVTSDAGAEAAVAGCSSDGDCNHGALHAGTICATTGASAGVCIAGCHADADCPTHEVCDEHASPHWACTSPDAGPADAGAANDAGGLGAEIAALARANVGKGACSANTLGGKTFATSCSGNNGDPEYWCADFALWVWEHVGVADTSELTAAAGSFFVYGQAHGTLANTPHVGDAVVFDYQGGGVAQHVALVVQVNADGTIETVSGDWGGTGSSESAFSSSSSVVLNTPAYVSTVGTSPSEMGMTISGFVGWVGK